MSRLLLAFGILAFAAARTQPANQPAQTGFVFDSVYLGHLAGDTGHPERPERLSAIRSGLERSGLMPNLQRITARRVTDAELTLVHTRAYVELVRKELSNLRGLADLSTGDTLASAGSFEAAQFAAGGVLNAVDAVMGKT